MQDFDQRFFLFIFFSFRLHFHPPTYATDAKLRRAIKEMPGETTVFIVSQRASSLMHADLIIVLDDGCVAAMGKHEQLLESCQVYQEIYYSQFEKSTQSGNKQ